MKAVALKDVCRITNGGTPKSGVESLWHGGVAWLTPAEMGKRVTPYIAQTARTISQDGLANSSAKLVPPNSVILSTRAPIGHLAINEIPMAFNQGCRGLTPGDKLDAKYLYYFLYFNREALDKLGTGTTFKELSSSNLASFQIPLPPLDEQRRIVAVLDKAFAGIATATANAQKNLTNARALFESGLNIAFKKIESECECLPLKEICDVRDGTHDTPKYVENGIPFVTQKNIRRDGLSFGDTKFISEIDHAKFYKRSNVAEGDILISMIGANRGMSCLVDDPRIFSIKNVGLIKANEKIDALYLLFFLNTDSAKIYVEAESRGGAQSFVGLTQLRSFPIPVAPFKQQLELVQKMEKLQSEAKNVEVIYQTKLAALTELKQSLLQKAFAGELT